MNTKGKQMTRRSTRNKTMMIDPREIRAMINRDGCKSNMQPGATANIIQARTFGFSDLMEAFKTIEKKVKEEPSIVKEVLKRFKTEEDGLHYKEDGDEQLKDKKEFPKILNSPFIQNDIRASSIKRNTST